MHGPLNFKFGSSVRAWLLRHKCDKPAARQEMISREIKRYTVSLPLIYSVPNYELN